MKSPRPADPPHHPAAGFDRRALGRLLTTLTDAGVAEALVARQGMAATAASHRIALTGPPGAGKSTLTAHLARHRLASGAALSVGVLAVDPSSPVSGGSILGDRIRIDALLEDPRLFVRSVPSRGDHDGLSDNLVDLIAAVEHVGVGEVVVETVGVGQSDTAVRDLADTMVVLIPPGGGDAVQAMKAGILEVADIVVVTKADTAGADRMAADLAATLRGGRDGWAVRVLSTSRTDEASIGALSDAIDEHRRHLEAVVDPATRRRRRLRDDVTRMLLRQVREAVAATPEATWELGFSDAHRAVSRTALGSRNQQPWPPARSLG